MAKKGTATAYIGLDYSAFEQSAKAVSRMVNVMAGAVSSAIGNVAATAFNNIAGAIRNFAGSIKQNIQDVYKMGEELANLSKRTGVATDQYLAFRMALEKGITRDEAAQIIGDNAEILSKNADIFRDITIKFEAVGLRLKGFWIGLAEKISPVLSKLLDERIAVNLVTAGQKFGESLSKAVTIIYNLVKDGGVTKALSLSFQIAVEYLRSGLIWAVESFSKAIVAVVPEIGKTIISVWGAIFTGLPKILTGGLLMGLGEVANRFGGNIGEVINRAANALGAAFIKAGELTFSFWAKGFGFVLNGIRDGFFLIIKSTVDGITKLAKLAVNLFTDPVQTIRDAGNFTFNKLGDIGKTVSSSLESGLASTKDIASNISSAITKAIGDVGAVSGDDMISKGRDLVGQGLDSGKDVVSSYSGIVRAIADAIKSTPFNLGEKGESLQKDLIKALEDASRPIGDANNISNQTPQSQQSFGVDSLSAAGGGGGIGIMTNIQERQLQSLQNIEKLMRGGDPSGRYENFYRRNADNLTDFTPFTRSR